MCAAAACLLRPLAGDAAARRGAAATGKRCLRPYCAPCVKYQRRRPGFCRVRTHEPERLRYFAELGLVPGTPFEILGRAPFNGPMRLRAGREEVVVGAELLKSVWVTPAENPAG